MELIDGGGAMPNQSKLIDGGNASGFLPGTPVGYYVQASAQAFQGDPRLIMGPDGTRIQFVGGQPLMDRGVENLVIISLFTNEGWCGNHFMQQECKIGSGFVAACNQPITRQSLNEVRAAAERALVNPALGRVTVTVTNPTGYQLKVHIVVEPPAGSPQALSLLKDGGSWQMQAADPAYQHVRDDRWRKALTDTEVFTFENGAPMEF